jgi:hypothetical protein
MEHQIECPHCRVKFGIWTFSAGMSDLASLPCSNCPIVLLMEPPYDRAMPKVFADFRCECGGEYRLHSSYHCPNCNGQFSMDEVKRQINWWGAPEGAPGVCVTKCIDYQRRPMILPSATRNAS